MSVHEESAGQLPHETPQFVGSRPHVRPPQFGTHAAHVPHSDEVVPQVPLRSGSMSAHDCGKHTFVPAASPIFGPPLMTQTEPN
jgi:hypothetical protein